MSKARTPEEIRTDFIRQCVASAHFWDDANIPDNQRERLEGLVHSILCVIDGVVGFFPALDLVARPHPDDKAYDQALGDDWIEDGTILNADVMLHDELHALLRAKGN